MPKRSPNYFLVMALLGVALCVTYWARTRPAVTLNTGDPASLPASLGTWRSYGRDIKPSKETLEGWSVDARNFLIRRYAGPDGVPLELLVVYKGLDRRGWHMSEMCFTGSGYNVTQSYTTVPYAGKGVRAVKLLAQDQDGMSSEIVVYMLAHGKEVSSNYLLQQLQMSLGRLNPSKDGWAYVRVTCPVSTSEEDAMRKIRDFLKAASGPLVGALNGSRVCAR